MRLTIKTLIAINFLIMIKN